MQEELFGSFNDGMEARIRDMRDCLREAFGEVSFNASRDPMSALVKSIISSRTKDEASLRAFNNLVRLYPAWPEMRAAAAGDIAAAIHEVTDADDKAHHVLLALAHVATRFPDYDLAPLGKESMETALAWLRSLPGAGPKVAASVMNFSTLGRPALVMDRHVLRVFRRTGLVGRKTGDVAVNAMVMSALRTWTAVQVSDLHVLVKRLGQVVCHARTAECRACPLQSTCMAARTA
ncbi:MAG: hypothetical protein WDN06_20555 [Asticcacaulis sp.]